MAEEILNGYNQDNNAYAIGSRFYIHRTLTHDSIDSAGLILTSATTGTLMVDDVIIRNGATTVSSTSGLEVINFITDNTYGTGAFFYIQPSIGANQTRSLLGAIGAGVTSVSYGYNTILDNGKKITVKTTGEKCTTTGLMDIAIVFTRLSDGATVSVTTTT